MKKSVYISLAIGASAIIVGCGGGGSDDGGTLPTTSSVSLSGTAVDELILNGVVKVKKSDNATVLSTGRTDANTGTYAIKANKESSLVVNVTCDDKTTLEGGKACPAGLDFNAVTNVDGDEVIVNVSPLTEVVYQLVTDDGKVTSDEVTTALAQISVMMQVNPNREDPTKGNYDLIVKSFHDVAQNQGISIADVIKAFSEDAKDGSLGDDQLSILLASKMKDNGLNNPFVANGGNYDLTTDPKVLSVKEFVQQIRTQGTVMEEYLTEESENIGKTLDAVTMDVDSAADYVGGMASLIMDAYGNNQDSISGKIPLSIYGSNGLLEADVTLTKTSNANEWSYTTTFPNSQIVHKGLYTLPNLPDGIQNTFTKLEADFNGNLPVIDYDNPTAQVKSQKVALHIALDRENTLTTVNISNCTMTDEGGNTMAVNSLTGVIDYKADPNDPNESVFNFVKIFKMDVSAKAGEYEVKGLLTIPEYVVNENLKPLGGVSEEEVTGFWTMLSCPNGPVTASYENTYMEIDGQKYTPVYFDLTYELSLSFEELPGHLTADEIKNNIVLDARCDDGSNIAIISTHTWYGYNDIIGNSGYVPKLINFEGSIKNISQDRAAELNGKISVDIKNAATLPLESLDNIGDEVIEALELKVKMDVKHTMINRPETSLSLVYETISDDAKAYHTLLGSFGYDNTLLSIDGKMDKTLKDGSLVFTDSTDIRAEFIFGAGNIVSGDIGTGTGSLIRKAGKAEASIEDRSGAIIVKYADGSFESIF